MNHNYCRVSNVRECQKCESEHYYSGHFDSSKRWKLFKVYNFYVSVVCAQHWQLSSIHNEISQIIFRRMRHRAQCGGMSECVHRIFELHCHCVRVQ